MDQRKKILQVAGDLMSRRGYKGTSIQEIANHVGIHKTTIFHYFKNKEELLLNVIEIGIQESISELESLIEDKSLSPEERLKRFIYSHLDGIVKYKNNVNVYHNDVIFLSREHRKKYLGLREHYRKCFETAVKEVMNSSSETFKELDLKIVTLGILGMQNWAVKWYKKSGKYSTKEITDIFYKMLVR
ncbi:MAG: TetR/AcrR family transcriptional regulator [Deltaproteobacteria bacterium]|nr:TetR/AcrR family transcriptional regulator [Deltaproteobacteria bacterium]